MATILNPAMLDSAILHKTLTQTSLIWLKPIHSHSTWRCQPSWTLPSWFSHFAQKRTSLIHSDSTWWWQLSWNLPSLIQPFCIKKLHSFILTQLDNGRHLELCHLGYIHFAQKRTSLIHSYSTWWWQPSWTLPCWIQTLPSWIQTPCHLLSDSLKNTLPPLWP